MSLSEYLLSHRSARRLKWTHTTFIWRAPLLHSLSPIYCTKNKIDKTIVIITHIEQNIKIVHLDPRCSTECVLQLEFREYPKTGSSIFLQVFTTINRLCSVSVQATSVSNKGATSTFAAVLLAEPRDTHTYNMWVSQQYNRSHSRPKVMGRIKLQCY